MTENEKLGLVVYGATGYTGRLVCEYLNNQYGVDGDISWGMAGRSQAKLEAVRDEMGIPAGVPLVVADADDPASIDAMVSGASVVITTVGPTSSMAQTWCAPVRRPARTMLICVVSPAGCTR